jgi:S1-C subfamily serine protease
MSRKGWFITAAIGGTLIVILIVLAYAFRESWAYPRTLGGPVALVKGEPPKHGFLGIEFTGTTVPLTIQSVVKGSGAADAGLQPGDVVISAGSAEQPDLAALQRVIQASAPGEELRVRVGRGPDEMEIRVRLISFTDMIVLREREGSGKAVP